MIRSLLKAFFVMLAAISAASSQSLTTQLTFGGSGTDSIHGVTTDANGNIYVVGTTYSDDLPLLNAFQSVNSGTQIVYSSDAGATWNPLRSPFTPGPNSYQQIPIAVDPANPATVYTASFSKFCKSQDSGKNFQCTGLSFLSPFGSVTQLLVDPHKTSTIYLSAIQPGLFVSTDAGQSWSSANEGLPQGVFPDLVTADPFHSGVLFVWAGTAGFVSHNGGASWTHVNLPYPSGVTTGETLFGFFFDAVTPGVVYGPGYIPGSDVHLGLEKSTDGGETWNPLSLPFAIASFIGADPTIAGTLYAVGTKIGSNASPSLWKSTDGGANWASTSLPAGFIGPLVFDPQNSQIILAAHYSPYRYAAPTTYRSTDGGMTWLPAAQRVLAPVFSVSAPGIVYASGVPTSDAFLAKFQPDGQTLMFATYFGGAGNDAGNVIALDPSGNIWIGGNTSSTDLAVAPSAFQSTLKGQTNGFLAKFTNDGRFLVSTYLGGSVSDTATSLAAGPDGTVWVGGSLSSPDFPFPMLVPILPSPVSYLAKLDPALQSLLVAKELDGWVDFKGNGISLDSAGNAIVTGSTTDPNFQTTVQPLVSPVSSASRSSRVFVQKLDASGAIVYAAAFGGSKAAPVVGRAVGLPSGGGLDNYGVAAQVDGSGNAYIMGYTSATDFPTTPGAFQTTLADACPYPAFETNTGLIGVIASFFMDDSFVVKLSPDGKTALYSTLIGGQCFDRPIGLAVDGSGRAVITGETDSFDYPQAFAFVGAPALDQFASFVSILNPAGSGLDFSSYLYAGSTPTVALAPGGTLDIAGGIGPGAQSTPFSGAYITPLTGSLSHGYIAGVTPASAPLNLTQVLNDFSLQPGPVAPGEIVALTLPGFIPDQSVDVGLAPQTPLATTLAGTTVLFDGRPAYLLSAASGKIVCIAPQEIAGQTTTAVQVMAGAGGSNILTENVSAVAVGLLSSDGSGTGLAAARNSDGSLNGPSNPALIGSQVTIYFTGGGVTNPPEPDGASPGAGVAPVASLGIYPLGGVAYALPGFVPGIFAYAFSAPASPYAASGSNTRAPVLVSVQTTFYQSQFLQIYVQ